MSKKQQLLQVAQEVSCLQRHSDAASDVGVSYHHNSPSSILDASSSSATSPNHLLDLSGKPLSAVQGEHGNSVFYDDPGKVPSVASHARSLILISRECRSLLRTVRNPQTPLRTCSHITGTTRS